MYQTLWAVMPSKNPSWPPCFVTASTTFGFALYALNINRTRKVRFLSSFMPSLLLQRPELLTVFRSIYFCKFIWYPWWSTKKANSLHAFIPGYSLFCTYWVIQGIEAEERNCHICQVVGTATMPIICVHSLLSILNETESQCNPSHKAINQKCFASNGVLTMPKVYCHRWVVSWGILK